MLNDIFWPNAYLSYSQCAVYILRISAAVVHPAHYFTLCKTVGKLQRREVAFMDKNGKSNFQFVCLMWHVIEFNSSWPSATYMRRDFQCLFLQRPIYVALISVLVFPVPHTCKWGVTNGSLLPSPPNSRRSPAYLISLAPHICGTSRTPIITRIVWKISNVVTKTLVVLPS